MAPSSLKLYYSPGACSLAAHVVLEEIGAPFELVCVSVRDGENLRPEYRAIHPLQRVPALAVGDAILTEVGAILHWLADAFPERRLAPEVGSWARGQSYAWCSFLASSVHIAFAQIWRPARFTQDTSAHPSVEKAGRAAVETFFEMIEARLAKTEYVLGDAFSLCDPYTLVFYRWGNRIGLPMERYPAWSAHAERMLARDTVQRVFAREGITLRS
ncbi:glutathione S-transferase N-terminal domain-containing protein [Polyangium sp. y55x31]|uniref:glutathione S-transferase family protein n=1 Tax=Polyangium sp. y55x31 TaxID=3042688 RepID=UPI0024821CA4|nr:glutathione S-transferase N-terminal domain-containing protein [Polyangium sp. y55x31]MDI1480353.1 glutathione S-transferase N-terminal domain-containing protein [Polyangium sp. y55x31]